MHTTDKHRRCENTSAHLLQKHARMQFPTPLCGVFLNGHFLTWSLAEQQSYQGAPQHRGRLHLVPRFSLASPGLPFPLSPSSSSFSCSSSSPPLS